VTAVGTANAIYSRTFRYGIVLPIGAGLQLTAAANAGAANVTGEVQYTQGVFG
jgi:hypothetical protein